MNTLKKWWWLIVPLAILSAYLYSIKDRIFETPEQRTLMIKDWKDSPTPEQKQKAFLLDSLNNTHAIIIRQKRYDDTKKNDSIRNVKDSLVLDIILRNADQFFQMRQSIDSIKSHH